MLRNYLKIMMRSLLKRKGFAMINLFGLATGMAICILLIIYIQNELGYDNFHEHSDQIYRLALERKYPTRTALKGHIPLAIGQAVKNEFPEVIATTRVAVLSYNGTNVMAGEKTFTENAILEVDSNFFQVFTGNFLEGDASICLQKPGTAVLNETTAKKYFGSAENAIGKNILVSESMHVTIAGICKDWPAKSHFKFNILISSSGEQYWQSPEYVYFGPYTYLLLNKNVSASSLEAKLPHIVDKYVAGRIAPLFGEPYDKFVAEGNGYRYFLQPIKEIHLHSELEDEMMPTVSFSTIRMFGAIAVFILFLACVNFINLSTALSVERAKEVGIRKTFGSQKNALVWEFLFESVLFSLASMLIALLFVFLLTPMLNKISGTEQSFLYLLNPLRFLSLIGFSIFIGIVAGLYPAFVLSSFEPITVLKGRFKSNRRGIVLRNALVVFQFAVSVILIICTIVVNRQMQFMLSDRLGFKKDNIITVERMWQLRKGPPGSALDKRQAFIDEISKIAGVSNISACVGLPGSDDSQGGATWIALDNNNSRTDRVQQADENYQKLLGLEMKEGRFFSKAFITDSLSIVLNERAVEDFGLKNPIGARLISKEPGYNPDDSSKGANIFTVVGVVKDFHYQSLYKKIAPLIMINSNKFGWGSIGLSIHGGNIKTTIDNIEKTWHSFEPKHDFTFRFLDQDLAAQYKSEQTEQKIFTTFSMLAIFIACIGLLGLATFSTLQRTKEISIRKVLGADPGNIIVILSKDFLKLIAIASLIAFPIAWWSMHKWLENFAYRADISWWIFLLAGFMAATIAILTISYQAIKAAFVNPLKSLKSE
jgi:putative ABC transport system permease protein